MPNRTSLGVLGALLAGAIAVSAGAAWAQAEGSARTEADCEMLRADWGRFTAEAHSARDEADEAKRTAESRRAGADSVRALTPAKRARALAAIEDSLKFRLEQRARATWILSSTCSSRS